MSVEANSCGTHLDRRSPWIHPGLKSSHGVLRGLKLVHAREEHPVTQGGHDTPRHLWRNTKGCYHKNTMCNLAWGVHRRHSMSIEASRAKLSVWDHPSTRRINCHRSPSWICKTSCHWWFRCPWLTIPHATCTMRPPAIHWFWVISTAACTGKRSWAAVRAAWNIGESIEIKKMLNQNPDVHWFLYFT